MYRVRRIIKFVIELVKNDFSYLEMINLRAIKYDHELSIRVAIFITTIYLIYSLMLLCIRHLDLFLKC